MTQYKRALIMFLLFFTQVLSAAPRVAPPNNKLTFDQYKFALKTAVSQVPDLAAMWKWTYGNGTTGVYLGGGALRGLIKWLHTQAQTHSYQELLKLKPPSIAELLIVKSADKDLYAPDHIKKTILDWETYKDWDVLAESFYKESVLSQGPTIDKVGVSPGYHDDIRDPFNALYEIYQGKLVLSFSNRKPVLIGDPKIGLVMRFLRFTIDLNDIAEGTNESFRLAREIILSEASQLPECAVEQPQWASERTESNSTQVRIARNVSSLMKAVGNDVFVFIRFLKSFDLFEPLAKKHYGIFHLKFKNPALELAKFRAAGLTHHDMFLFAHMAAWDIDRAKSFHEFLIVNANSNDELVESLTYFWKNPTKDYLKEVGAVLDKYGTNILARLDYKSLSPAQKTFFNWILLGRPHMIQSFHANEIRFAQKPVVQNKAVAVTCQMLF